MQKEIHFYSPGFETHEAEELQKAMQIFHFEMQGS